MTEMVTSCVVVFFVGCAAYRLIRLAQAKKRQRIEEMNDGLLATPEVPPWDEGSYCNSHRLGEFCCGDCGPCNDKLCHRCFLDDLNLGANGQSIY